MHFAPAGRWYSGCGIYRPVKLIAAGDVHLNERRIAVTTQAKKWLPGFVTAKGYIGDRLAFDTYDDLPSEKGYEVMLTVRVQDEQGNPLLRDNRAVAFTVSGNAVPVATDNGDWMETQRYLY